MARRRNALAAAGAGLAIGAALVVASLAVSRPDAAAGPLTSTDSLAGVDEVTRLLDSIPQQGTALGRADAPVTLVEYADFQCPYCAQWALGTLPVLVDEYVRAGKLRIEFRGLAFIGPDSETALQVALAAGRQDKLWHMVELLYANQGAENAGWVTEGLIARAAARVGVQSDQLAADRHSAAVHAEIAKSKTQAQAAGVRGTPTFTLGRTGEALLPLAVSSLGPTEFRDAIEEVLAG